MKVYERLILCSISQHVENQLTFDQDVPVVYRSQNLKQHIKDGFEKKLITGAVFVDSSTAFDTINDWALIHKISQLIKNTTVTLAVQSLLTNEASLLRWMATGAFGEAREKACANDWSLPSHYLSSTQTINRNLLVYNAFLRWWPLPGHPIKRNPNNKNNLVKGPQGLHHVLWAMKPKRKPL